MNRYKIRDVLQSETSIVLSPSTIYNIYRRYGLNKLCAPFKADKKDNNGDRLGELAHIDCHDLSRGITLGGRDKIYLLGVIDGYSRVAWAEVIDDKKAMTVMSATIKSFNILKLHYGIKFSRVGQRRRVWERVASQ